MKFLALIIALVCSPVWADEIPPWAGEGLSECNWYAGCDKVRVAYDPVTQVYVGRVLSSYRGARDSGWHYLEYPVNGATAYLSNFNDSLYNGGLARIIPDGPQYYSIDSTCDTSYGTYTTAWEPDNFGSPYIFRRDPTETQLNFYQLDLNSPLAPTNSYYRGTSGSCLLVIDPAWAVFYPVVDIVPYDVRPSNKYYPTAYITEVVTADDDQPPTQSVDTLFNSPTPITLGD